MLSKKQLWRKVLTSPRPTSRSSSIDGDEMDIDIEDNKEKLRTTSDLFQLERDNKNILPPRKLRSALSLSNLSEMEKLLRPKEQRNIRFSSTVHVCLIPTRQEMKMTIDELFWKPCDYNTFKMEAVAELKALLTSQGLTPKQAITELYQPNDQDREYDMIIDRNNDFKNNNIDDKNIFYDNNNNSDNNNNNNNNNNDNNNNNNSSSNGKVDDIKFITNIKTDVELNEASIASSPNRTSNLPTHTPSGGQQLSHVWTVNWKKSDSNGNNSN